MDESRGVMEVVTSTEKLLALRKQILNYNHLNYKEQSVFNDGEIHIKHLVIIKGSEWVSGIKHLVIIKGSEWVSEWVVLNTW